MDSHGYEEMASLQNVHWWFRGRRELLRKLLTIKAPEHPRKIVEIGCGVGGNLQLLSEFGPVIGIEVSPTAISLLPASFRGQVYEGRLPSPLPLEAASCDWVCLFDVLEHVEDDIGALAACRALLSPRGTIIVSVPAYQWLWSEHDVSLHHHRRYTRRRLLTVARAAGLDATFSTYFNSWLFPIAAVTRLADRLLGRRQGSLTGLPSHRLNGLLERIFTSEWHWLRRLPLPFGLSIFVVMQARPGR